MWDREKPKFILAGVLSAVCFGLSLNALILSTDLAEHSRGFQRVQEAELAMTPLMGIFRLCIRAPFLEELMFRLLLCYGGAYVLGRLMPRKWASGIALVLSSLVFALLHGNIVQGLYAFLMGLLLGGFLLASRILYISFLMHAAANLTVYGLGLSGFALYLYNPFCAALFFALGLLALKLLLPREMLRVRKPDAALGKCGEGRIPRPAGENPSGVRQDTPCSPDAGYLTSKSDKD